MRRRYMVSRFQGDLTRGQAKTLNFRGRGVLLATRPQSGHGRRRSCTRATRPVRGTPPRGRSITRYLGVNGCD